MIKILELILRYIPYIKKVFHDEKPYSENAKIALEKLIIELNSLVLIVQYGPVLNEECFYLRFGNLGKESDYNQYAELNLFEAKVCFNPEFPNKRIRKIFNNPFFSEPIFNKFNFLSKSLGKEGSTNGSGCVYIMDASQKFSLTFKHYPDKFVTFRDFYRELVNLQETIEITANIKFKQSYND